MPISDKYTKFYQIWCTFWSPSKPFYFTKESVKKDKGKNGKSYFYKLRKKSLKKKVSIVPNINSANVECHIS